MGDSITYVHNSSASFMSQFLQSLMSIAGMKNIIERRLKKEKFLNKPAQLPKSLRKNFDLNLTRKMERKIWTLKPKSNVSEKVILYIHGGAYIINIIKFHWKLIEALLLKTNATIIVPDYPLAPDANYNDVYDYFNVIYQELLTKVKPENIIIMGDSAGGGFAIGFAQRLRNENKPQPSQIILLSPWLDITMSNPDILDVDKKDRILGIKGLKIAGKMFADNIDTKDYRVSPIYGDFLGLGKISLFIGTNDLFIADARKLKEELEIANIPINYFEYPKMFHVWLSVTNLKEAKHAIDQLALLIR